MRVYLLNENGIDTNAFNFDIDQNIATHCPGTTSGYGSIGYIKGSPDGTKLAMANFVDGFVGLYTFNSFTGEVSDEKVLPVGDKPYGIEFSPDSKFLYVSFIPEDNLPVTKQLRQYDTSLSNELAVYESERNVITSAEAGFIPEGAHLAAMQLGPDDRIYVATTGQNKISVITNPNGLGSTCQFKARTVDLGGTVSRFGLPMFFQQKLSFDLIWGDSCSEVETSFQLIGSQFSDLTWSFGDGSDPVSMDTGSTINHTFEEAGDYTIHVNFTDYFGEQHSLSKLISISDKPSPNDNLVYTRESVYPGIIVDKPELDSLIRDGISNVSVSYHYSPEEAEADENPITPPNMTFHDGIYFAKTINNYSGCTTVVPFEVEVILVDEDDNQDNNEDEIAFGCTPSIPNAFTPNSDGINDRFISFNDHEHGCIISVKSIALFDRWGNMVYEGNDPEWNGLASDGRRLPKGIYMYRLTYDFTNDYGEVQGANTIGTVQIIY